MRILLVEDDLQLGAGLQRALELESFASRWVRRLAEARLQLASHAPVLVVLDLNLPDGEGYDLLRELRRAPDAPSVLVITAREALADRLRGFELGADDFLVKPFAVPELIARVRAVLRRALGPDPAEGRFGALAIDEARRLVTLHGAAVALTPIEYRLLLELTRRPGYVVTRETLIERVWSDAEEGSDAMLDYHVHGLRRKIGAERVVTERGVGLRFAVPEEP